MTLRSAKKARWLLPMSEVVALSLLAWSPCQAAAETPAWERKRTLESFRPLLSHSPFSLPTAEQNSPLSERYALTGIVSVGGVDQVFVFDKTDQSRELIGRSPNSKGMSLVAVLRDTGSSPKASISIGGETGTIGFLESQAPPSQPPAQQAPQPGSPAAAPIIQQGAPATGAPQQPGSPQAGRRIIRRPVINAPQPVAPHP